MIDDDKLRNDARWLFIMDQLKKCRYAFLEETMSREEINNTFKGLIHYMFSLGGDFEKEALGFLEKLGIKSIDELT
jgi:hypothetical protein